MNFTELHRDDGITVLKLEGRMDIEGAEEISLRMAAATAGEGRHVVADLAEVSFMSSIGIGMLVSLAQSIVKRHGNLVLLDPQPVVWMVLEKTRIPDIITVHMTLADALTAVQGHPPKLRGRAP